MIPRPQPSCELPPRPRRPARRATAPRRRRDLSDNKITGPISTEIGELTALWLLRGPPASPTPGAARDRPSASQGSQLQPDQGSDPDRDRPAHGAEGPASSPRVPGARRAARPPSASQDPRPQPDRRHDSDRDRPARGAADPASSPRVPDARRAARAPLGVAGSSKTTRSPARSRPCFATSRSVPPSPATTSSRRAARRTAAVSWTMHAQ